MFSPPFVLLKAVAQVVNEESWAEQMALGCTGMSSRCSQPTPRKHDAVRTVRVRSRGKPTLGPTIHRLREWAVGCRRKGSNAESSEREAIVQRTSLPSHLATKAIPTKTGSAFPRPRNADVQCSRNQSVACQFSQLSSTRWQRKSIQGGRKKGAKTAGARTYHLACRIDVDTLPNLASGW